MVRYFEGDKASVVSGVDKDVAGAWAGKAGRGRVAMHGVGKLVALFA